MKYILTISFVFLTFINIINASSSPKTITTKLKKGNVQSYNLDKIRMHVYQTKDLMNDICIVLEKNGNGVIIESPAFKDNFNEFREYLVDNNIDIKGIIPSYHPLGATFIETTPLNNIDVYLTKSTINYWDDGFGAVMKQGIPIKFGDNVDAKIYKPTIIPEEGKLEIAGFKMLTKNTYDGFDIEIPEIKTVYVHILGHDTHSEILGLKHLQNSIKNLQTYIDKGYETFLSSHYIPETKEDAKTKIKYLQKMKKIIAESPTGEKFIENMNTSFPNYKTGYLIQTTRMFYKDFQLPKEQG